jgi:ankyrin repeat protein
MGHRHKQRATLAEILASTSDTLFPAELGRKSVTIDSRDCDGDTPLHVMVRRKDRHAVRLLLAAGADVDATGDMGETPLHVAVSVEDAEIIEALLEAGARTNIRSEFGDTAAERAAKKGGKIAAMFRQHGPR